MPLLTLHTNVSIADRDITCFRLSSELSRLLDKPESYVMVMIEDEQTMSFAGTSEPLAMLNVKSLGLPEDQTAAFSRTLCTLVANELSIRTDRIYIEFHSPQRHMWGWKGKTFGGH